MGERVVWVAWLSLALLPGVVSCSADSDEAGRGGSSNAGSGEAGASGKSGEGGSGPMSGAGGSSGGSAPVVAESCKVDANCGPGRACKAEVCELSGECGASEFQLGDVPPNLMILLDRSCSMPACTEYPGTAWVPLHPCFTGSIIPGIGAMIDKWGASVAAIDQLTMDFNSQILWGLQFFPDAGGDACTLDAPSVSPGPGTEPDIQMTLANALMPTDPNFPNGPCNTMTGGALVAMSMNETLRDPDRNNYILLITDGAEFGCKKDAGLTEQTVADMFADGIPTFVVGFGGEVDAVALDDLALAGGVPNPAAASNYYQADDQAGLQTALEVIVGSVLGCDFALGEAPPNTNELYAFLDDEEAKRDDPDGWRYDTDTNQVRFQGASCAALQDGTVTDIDVVFGCPQPVLE